MRPPLASSLARTLALAAGIFAAGWPTDLVHETYLRLCEQNAAWENRDQFFGVASRLMRRILVDPARSRAAAKRGAGLRVTLPEDVAASTPGDPDLLDLDAALDELAALDEGQARLVERRYLGGLTLEETARVLGSSPATVSRDWATAKAWLYRRLKTRLLPRAASPPTPGRRSSR